MQISSRSLVQLSLGYLKKMVNANLMSGNLDNSFSALMVSGGGESGQAQNGGLGTILSGWKDLPMELLLRIISVAGDDRMVVVASGVCTGWRDALGWGVTSLSFSWCQDHMNDLVISLAHKFPKLQVLSLRQIKPQLEDSAVEAVANYCHDLRELDLSRSFRLTDRSLYALAHGCLHLTRLNISGSSNFSDAALVYLTSQCRNLKCLNLCGCVRAASDRALQAIARNCDQLQSLNLGWCDNITDKGVTSLASGCPELRAVDLCGCVLITDESVVALANGCPHLRSLGLYYCQNITDRAMYSLAANSRVRGKGMSWDAGRSSRSKDDKDGLASLNISQCTALTPPAVQAVCDSFPALHTCPERHSLIISGCLSLTSVHCACALHPHRAGRAILSNHAY
ncbi:F-box protein SKP2A isoform X2 [Brachypodium distachyon]|uniref:F-box protein SKP2A isoform X2 n=1 Tax=Brachypodium distachyon TaxID=15368 RepID=UPI00052FE298|nr:F-box protein SKP2A isoform X2 [Brachypodium distachyon]|eukprot:XP_024315013.1 F-box protein SKP2A isoform X2 [Brachypodium distachyon]